MGRIIFVYSLDHCEDTRIQLLDQVSDCLESSIMISLLSVLDLHASEKDKRYMTFCSLSGILSNEAAHFITKVEFRTKSASSLHSHLMPVTKDISCEWVAHVIFSNPALNFVHELCVFHVNVLIESFLAIEPLNVVPDIWFCGMRSCNDHFASRDSIPNCLSSRLVLLLEFSNSCFSCWKGTFAINNDRFGIFANSSHWDWLWGGSSSASCSWTLTTHLIFINVTESKRFYFWVILNDALLSSPYYRLENFHQTHQKSIIPIK